jgi:hypothetical protein
MRRVLSALALPLLVIVIGTTGAGAVSAAPATPEQPTATQQGSNQPSGQPGEQPSGQPSPQPSPQQTGGVYKPNAPESWKKPGIPKTWPSDGSSLWVPVREGRFSSDKPIDASTVSARLVGGSVDEELTRLTKGNNVTSVLFKIPNLDPGTYTITWAHADKTEVTKFEIQQPVLAPGGGNHRGHESNSKPAPWPQRISLGAVVLVGGLALLNLAGLWVIPLIMLSALGSIIALTASAVAFVGAYNGAAFGDSPWATGFAAPGVWGFLIISLVLAAMPLTRSLGTGGRLAGVGALSAVAAGAGHSHAAVSQTYTVTISVLVGLAGAAAIATALNAISTNVPVNRLDRLFITASLSIGALLSVFVHSMFAAPVGAFTDAYVTRIVASSVLVAAMSVIRPWGGPWLRRVASIIGILFVVIAVIVLTQVPPLTAGL